MPGFFTKVANVTTSTVANAFNYMRTPQGRSNFRAATFLYMLGVLAVTTEAAEIKEMCYQLAAATLGCLDRNEPGVYAPVFNAMALGQKTLAGILQKAFNGNDPCALQQQLEAQLGAIATQTGEPPCAPYAPPEFK